MSEIFNLEIKYLIIQVVCYHVSLQWNVEYEIPCKYAYVDVGACMIMHVCLWYLIKIKIRIPQEKGLSLDSKWLCPLYELKCLPSL